MKTVRMLRTGSHPVLDGLFAPVRRRFAESLQYQLLDDDSTEPADVILAFLPDGDDIDQLGIERRTYQDFVGIFFIADAAESDAQRVVRSYEVGLRCMANLAGYTEITGDGPQDYRMTLITPERGHEVLTGSDDAADWLFDLLLQRSDVTYIDENIIHSDLPEDLHDGTDVTRKMREMARRLDDLNLVPSAVVLDGLSERARRRFFKVLGQKQVSYGNMSARHAGDVFWMTGRGVNKAKLDVIGKDILLVSKFDPDAREVHITVPPGFEDSRASIDSSIHAAIYREFAEIGAMIHIHWFVDGIVYTDEHYPCGTIELCESTLNGLRQTDDPLRTILGLANHGIIVTGADLEDCWAQIEAKLPVLEPAGS
jgi:ribulose-5-phosphate 4-epimerase/fuculose-1-phosphate aldolase